MICYLTANTHVFYRSLVANIMNRLIVVSVVFLSIYLSSGTCYQDDTEKPSDEVLEDETEGTTVLDVIQSMYSECLSEGSFSCVKPKLLSFLSASVKNGNIAISRDLSISPKEGDTSQVDNTNLFGGAKMKEAADMIILERLDKFLTSHELRMKVPEELQFIPGFLKHIPREVKVPLVESSDENKEESRGFMKKVALPFLLALKFKVSALVPLALTLIALKAWKALTLGVLSIVLSVALILFKIAKPKVVNYEVLHYPAVEHYHGHGKSLESHQLAYRFYG